MNINKKIIHYSISIISLKGVSFLMLPIITGYLSTEVYGELNFLVSLVSMLSIFLTFGLSEIIFRFTPKLSDFQKENFISECLFLSFTIGFLFITLFFIFNDFLINLLPIKVSNINLAILMVNLSISLVLAVFFANLRLKEKSFEYMILSLIQGFSQAIMNIFFLKYNFELKGILLSGLISTSIITIYFIIKNNKMFSVKKREFKKIHFAYGFKIAIASLFVYLLGGAENWFIIENFGKEKLAFYFIATQFVLALSLLFEPYRMWWYPIRFKYYFKSKTEASRYASMGCCVICILSSLMIVISPYLIDLMLPESYNESIKYIPVLSIILIIKTYAELLNLGCYLDEKATSVLYINGISALISIISIYIGIYNFEMKGVFIGLLIAHLLRFCMFYKISQNIVYLNYDKFSILLMFIFVLMQCFTYKNNLIINIFSIIFMISYFYFKFLSNKKNIKEVKYEF